MTVRIFKAFTSFFIVNTVDRQLDVTVCEGVEVLEMNGNFPVSLLYYSEESRGT